MKTKLLFIMAILCLNVSIAQDFTVDGINYNIIDASEKTVEVTWSYPYYSGTITIPEQVMNSGITYDVIRIGDAFEYCEELVTVNLPNSITSILDYAFYYSSISSLTLPTNLEYLGTSAFEGCSNLSSLVIPDTVTTYGDYILAYTGISNVTLPNNLPSIPFGMFYQCTDLTSISLPNTVTEINGYAFLQSGLTSLLLPENITTIGESAFEYCYDLSSINFPSSLTSLGDRAFSNTGLTEVELFTNLESIPYAAFYNCTNLTSVTIPESVTLIDEWAFGVCTALTSVTVDITTPLNINTNVFYDVTLSGVDLFVPTASVTDYQNAAVWQDFKSVSSSSTLSIGTMDVTTYKVYPNPAQHTLYITDSPTNNLKQVRIFNVLGKTVKTSNESTINVESLSNGTYFVQIETEEGETSTTKFIKE